jgi:glycosyltransferase involved in cell wall biosynthesis
MLDSIARLNKKDISPHLLWLGGGKYREEMIDRAEALGIRDQVDFPGRVNSDRVKAELSRSDLFVLPSRMEGLPRAMIEAMAKGLPCIGTNVDGIPELVDTHCTVPPNDSEALAEAIHDLVVDPDEMSQQAAQNLQKAKEYHHDILSTRREDLYLYLYKQTQEFSEDNNG